MDGPARVFRTRAFSKLAKKASLNDDALCTAVRQAMRGQAVDLGGGVYKKRLNENRHRAIILAKGGRLWVYIYLFAKQDRDNIDDNELITFRELAKAYESLTAPQLDRLLQDNDIMEICNGERN